MATTSTAAKTATLPKEVFAVEVANHELLKLAYDAYLANNRLASATTKTRGEVRGGGKKPWRQKGTGRARAGTIRSPIWVGGGRAFAAKPRDFDQKVNKKMYRGAIKSILSELIRQDRLVVVEKFGVDAPKTKALISALNEYELNDVLIVTPEVDENLFLAARNLYKVDVRDVAGIDPVSLIAFEKVLMTADAVKQLEEALA